VVEADSGAIGGSFSHEFMVLADSGEDALAFCASCDYAANLEKAELKTYPTSRSPEENLTKAHTPGCRHVPQLAAFMKTSEDHIIKSMLFLTEAGTPVLVLIPGHREINLVKLKNALCGSAPALASPEEAERIMGVPMGFVTPIGAKVRIIADLGISRMTTGIVGSGESDYHYLGAKPGRDFQVESYHDLASVVTGDPCPRCGRSLTIKRGIEVGHIFKLGVKYSQALGANFTKADGSEAPIVMGCYGIGLGRTVAASVEQNHDSDGIIWPMALAPFQVGLLPLQVQNPEVSAVSERLFDELTELGVETLYDDRDIRPGLKFKDADLLGLPLRLAVSERALAQGQVELKNRRGREVPMIPTAEAAGRLKALVADTLKEESERS
jgi:prolyl-tRNA synthetase